MTPPTRQAPATVLRILISRGVDTSWHAQAIECDLTAVSHSRAASLDALVKVIEVHVAHDARVGRAPLSRLAAAPEARRAAFERAARVIDPVELAADARRGLRFLVANSVDDGPDVLVK